MFTFEKITGHFLRSARQELLKRVGVGSSPTNGDTGDAAAADSVHCGRLCREIGADCPAYYVDYAQVNINASLSLNNKFNQLFLNWWFQKLRYIL